jgi:hypothetical protein
MRASLLRLLISFSVVLAATARADQYCVTVPPNAYRFVGCNLSIASISFCGNSLNKFNSGFTIYHFDCDDLVWTPNNPTPITRGDAALYQHSFSPLATNQVCFTEPTNAPVLPLNLASGSFTRVSCQSNVVATFEDVLGRSPVNGT